MSTYAFDIDLLILQFSGKKQQQQQKTMKVEKGDLTQEKSHRGIDCIFCLKRTLSAILALGVSETNLNTEQRSLVKEDISTGVRKS